MYLVLVKLHFESREPFPPPGSVPLSESRALRVISRGISFGLALD
jgi:hypothetical protein